MPFARSLLLAVLVAISPLPVPLAAAQPIGPEFNVNTFTTSSQRFSKVATDTAGDFVVVWQSYVSGSANQVRARR